ALLARDLQPAARGGLVRVLRRGPLAARLPGAVPALRQRVPRATHRPDRATGRRFGTGPARRRDPGVAARRPVAEHPAQSRPAERRRRLPGVPGLARRPRRARRETAAGMTFTPM